MKWYDRILWFIGGVAVIFALIAGLCIAMNAILNALGVA